MRLWPLFAASHLFLCDTLQHRPTRAADALVHSRPRFGMLAHLPLSVDPPTNRGGLHPQASIAYANT
jgi:hypothetical protein